MHLHDLQNAFESVSTLVIIRKMYVAYIEALFSLLKHFDNIQFFRYKLHNYYAKTIRPIFWKNFE